MISSNRRPLKDLYDFRKRREIKTSDPVNKSKIRNILPRCRDISLHFGRHFRSTVECLGLSVRFGWIQRLAFC